MTNPEIIEAIKSKDKFTELEQIKEALDAKMSEVKAAFMEQAEQMGLSCSDGNGKPRKRRANAKHPEA
jgi:hypothetical protein